MAARDAGDWALLTGLVAAQELRSRVGASSSQAGAMLQEAQEICEKAERRADAA